METARIAELLAPFVPHPLTEEPLAKIAGYLDLLLRWNQRINLTSVRDPQQIVTRHFGESLFAAANLFRPAGGGPTAPGWAGERSLPHDAGSSRVIDVGSGAGFPGLPIRIYAPVALTLIESRQRKAAFLREVARLLDFSEVEVFAGRAEDYPAKPASVPVTVTLRAVERFEQALSAAADLLRASSPSQQFGRASRLALLIGTAQVERARELEPEFAWADPIRIPQSQSRVLLVGQLADPH